MIFLLAIVLLAAPPAGQTETRRFRFHWPAVPPCAAPANTTLNLVAYGERLRAQVSLVGTAWSTTAETHTEVSAPAPTAKDAPHSVDVALPVGTDLEGFQLAFVCSSPANRLIWKWRAGAKGVETWSAEYAEPEATLKDAPLTREWLCGGACGKGRGVAALIARAQAGAATAKKKGATDGEIPAPGPELIGELDRLTRAMLADAVAVVGAACVSQRCSTLPGERARQLDQLRAAKNFKLIELSSGTHLKASVSLGGEELELSCDRATGCQLTVLASDRLPATQLVRLPDVARLLVGKGGEVTIEHGAFTVQGAALR